MIASNAKQLLKKENALKNLRGAPEGIDQKNLEEYALIIAMKQNHKNELLMDIRKWKTGYRFGTSTIPSVMHAWRHHGNS